MKITTSKVYATIGLLSFLGALWIVSIGNAEWRFWHSSDPRSDGTGISANTASAQERSGTEGMTPQEAQIIQTVRRAEPSVVSVIVTKDLPKMEQSFEAVPFGQEFGFSDSPFRGFRIQIPQLKQNGTEKREVGGGTAFFVTADGLLLTNKHVVDDEKADYTVLLNDERKLPAKVVARDPGSDIAILKVEGGNFTPLPIAQSDDLSLGQTAIAIGNTLGEYRNTVSVGVVSGLQRSITASSGLGGSAEQLDQIIQTDAAINSGNSGGPLLNSSGEVIGMNTAVSAIGQNVGFALPAQELRRVLASFQKNGRIVQPYLGVRFAPITPDLKDRNHLAYDYGVLIVHGEAATDLAVQPGSPADKVGLVENDIILEADGQKLTEDVSLVHLVQSKAPGDRMTLKIAHKGVEKEVTVTLEEWK
ncbi:MAG: trypsin-like peptidase domain-containing protein [Candidatus Peribacteraceae bacterium]|nr:trypsin-like peptidase domain-containing protein [Candidatus Peribacteraceae bacterium]